MTNEKKRPSSANVKRRVYEKLTRFTKSIWFFPAILLACVIILSALQINGSSIGIYHQLFYGDAVKDEDLLLNSPRIIRSDEWLVTTQLSLAQTNNDFSPVNTNIGDGIDVSLLVDAPTTDIVQLFKPQNLAFFVLPAGVAFSVKWWMLAYLLVISVYFFILLLLPRKRLLAALLSLSFLASPFIAWWYQYITLAPIYYALFGIVVAAKLFNSQSIKQAALWGALLSYVATSFALVLYPPFQIPCILFVLAFLVGYFLDNNKTIFGNIKSVIIGGSVAAVLTVSLLLVCLLPKMPVIDVVGSTAYPGNRITDSGGFNPVLLLASNTSLLYQSDTRAAEFSLISNQSEGSNFLLVFIFLVPVMVFFVIKYRKNIPSFWTVLTLLLISFVFTLWLFVPGLDILGKITLLNRVPHERLLIGFGLVNITLALLLVRILEKKKFKLPKYVPAIYSLVVLLIYLVINLYIAHAYPGFMGQKWAILLAMPYPIVIYLFLVSRFNIAAAVLLVFSVLSVAFVHPLYRGVDVLSNSELSHAIKSVDPDNNKRWVTDSLQLENYALLNGKKSLSGVYVYPDLGLWKDGFSSKDAGKYNRYAHVHFQLDRNDTELIQRKLYQPTPDQLIPVIEPCDDFLRDNNVGYILTANILTPDQAHCSKFIRQVSLPKVNIYIYEMKF